MIIKTRLFRVIFKWLICLSIALTPIFSQAQNLLTLPIWADIFDTYGNIKDSVDASGESGANGIADYIDLYDAADAIFVGDNISDSQATDMSIASDTQTLSSTVVRNGTVAAKHDVGNSFVMAKYTDNGDLQLFGGVERIAGATQNSFIEFEFNQEIVQVFAVDTAIKGERVAGDLLVRLNVEQGVLTGSQVKRWKNSGEFETLTTVSVASGLACNGNTQSHVICDPWLASGQHNYQSAFDPWTEGWDLDGNPVIPSSPNAVLEFAVNVKQLLGTNPEFTSIIVRTPKDLILEGFREIGHWASN